MSLELDIPVLYPTYWLRDLDGSLALSDPWLCHPLL